MAEPGGKRPLLDRETLVPVGLLIAVVLSSITATVWINTQLLDLIHSVKETNMRVDVVGSQVAQLQLQISNSTAERWTKSDMIRWVELVNAATNSKMPLPR